MTTRTAAWLPRLCLGLGLLLALGLAGCDKVTSARYETIREGMSYAEVVGILGEPTDSQSLGLGPFSGTSATWNGQAIVVSIQFLNDKVKLKSMRSR